MGELNCPIVQVRTSMVPVLVLATGMVAQTSLAGAGGPALAELARGVLEGRTTIRDVARSFAYATATSPVMQRLQQWNANLTDEERDQLVADTKTELHDS
jgi:hypothetical protein